MGQKSRFGVLPSAMSSRGRLRQFDAGLPQTAVAVATRNFERLKISELQA
jgi:hypothetical protein